MKARVKIIFKDGSFGYYKSKECITSIKENAKTFSKSFANGLCEGLNFSIKTYEDSLTDRAEVEVIE